MKYKVTIVETKIYDVEIEANTFEEAQDLALVEDPTRWVLDEQATSVELGTDHLVWDTKTNDWVYQA